MLIPQQASLATAPTSSRLLGNFWGELLVELRCSDIMNMTSFYDK
jgi:hypothetical protein